MGTSRSAVELARKFEALAEGVERRQIEAAKDAALAVKETVTPLMRQATGGDFVLSGTARAGGKGGAKIGVRFDTVSMSNGAATVIVKATGPAQLIESDVAKHFVFSRFARADGQRARTKSFVKTDADGTVQRDKRGRAKRVRVDTRSAAKAFGLAVGGGRRAVLRLPGDRFRQWTVASSKGRAPWARGVAIARPRAAAAFRAANKRLLTDSFR